MRSSLESILEKSRADLCLDLLIVAGVNGITTKEHYEEVLDYFKQRLMSQEDWKRFKGKSRKVFDADDSEQSRYAAGVLSNYFKHAGSRVN